MRSADPGMEIRMFTLKFWATIEALALGIALILILYKAYAPARKPWRLLPDEFPVIALWLFITGLAVLVGIWHYLRSSNQSIGLLFAFGAGTASAVFGFAGLYASLKKRYVD